MNLRHAVVGYDYKRKIDQRGYSYIGQWRHGAAVVMKYIGNAQNDGQSAGNRCIDHPLSSHARRFFLDRVDQH